MSKKKNTKEVEFVGKSSKRLTYKEMDEIRKSLTKLEKPYQPYPYDSHWWRFAENDNYAYESDDWTADHRIIDKKNNEEVWSYYGDFYTG